MRYRILVADDLAEEGLQLLRQYGDVTVRKGMDESTLRDALAGVHALVVRSATQVTERSLELAADLVLVGRAGIGVDNIDVAAAIQRGIVVMNTPEAGATTTGEHAIALLLALARNLAAADASLRSGRWDKSRFTGVEVTGKTLGVLGLGRIGRVVADRGRGLGMVVVAHDPHVAQEHAPAGVRMVTFAELLAGSDFVSVHVPLTDSSRHLLGRAELAAMKRGARLVHAARGGIVDEAALCDALQSGHLAGAALDVFEVEPLPADSPLRTAPNLLLTPHLGASTHEARQGVSVAMAQQVVMALRDGVVLDGVNVPRVGRADAALLGPYLTLAQRLASFLAQLHPGRLQRVELRAQGAVAAAGLEALAVAALVGALRPGAGSPVTPVNARRIAAAAGITVATHAASWKRDFQHLVQVELEVDGVRHAATGTVLGHRHGRMVELDGIAMDAIPEPPSIVTFHRDAPGVVGRIGTLLGSLGVNIARMQTCGTGAPGQALAILQIDRALEAGEGAALAGLSGIERVVQVT